jgi:choline dehydrogenase
MGRADDPMAVVDARLRVRGIAGLRIVDAGVMPTITSGNTNSPVLMMAEKAARWIMADAA